jgi:hypothetical protein
MSNVNSPLYKATGIIRILDKDRKVKQELKVTDFRPNTEKAEPKEANKDED